MKSLEKFMNFDVTQVSGNDTLGVFSISPLPTGFGDTIGNVLRRVLLSSIRGAAISTIRIEGVAHEFTTIEGMKEDVLRLTLNLKQLRFKLNSDTPQLITLEAKGEGEVTGANIVRNSACEVMNPDLHIATLTSKSASLNIQLLVEPGYGYVTRESEENSKVGVITVDSNFSPVLAVSMSVSPVRVGEDTDLDNLNLTIKTDGSVTPQEALTQSSELLVKYFVRISGGSAQKIVDEALNASVSTEAVAIELTEKETKMSVDDLDLPVRTVNALRKSGIDTLGKLVSTPNSELNNIRGLGGASIKQIQNLIENEEWK